MSSPQTGNVIEDPGTNTEHSAVDGNIFSSSLPHLEMDSIDKKSKGPEFQFNSCEQISHGKPISKDTSDILTYQPKKISCKKDGTLKTGMSRSPISKQPLSSIPLRVKSPKSLSPSKVPSQTTPRSGSGKIRSNSGLNRTNQMTNKHTLEIQFINKKKRLSQLKKDLVEKQRPVVDLYQNLLQIKKRLEELGKAVQLEELKLVLFDEEKEKPPPTSGGGESISPEFVLGMQTSIEEIPKTLMEICKNLLNRRAVIVELLEGVTKSEVDVGDLSDKIETLKSEGMQLQNNLDVIINEHEKKINELVINWQTLLNDKKNINTNTKIDDLENKLQAQEKLIEESNQLIHDLQKKLEERRNIHDKSMVELNNVIHTLKENILKLELELENEKKSAADFKNRNSANAQSSKMLRSKITDLENDKKATDYLNSDLNKKVKLLQDQIKHKEAQWNKEKEDLSKNLKHQENLLQKLTADKNNFETRLEQIEGERSSLEEDLQNKISELEVELKDVKEELNGVTREKEEATEKCKEMQDYISKMGLECRQNMTLVSSSIEWGKDIPSTVKEAQNYSSSLVKDIVIRDCQDKIKLLEEENCYHKQAMALVEHSKTQVPTETEKAVMLQHDIVLRYKQLLAESENKLNEKSQEVAKLTSEIRQLKVRQEHLEELNLKCPTENLQKMVEEGRQKLSELMKKSMESEQKILHYENVIDKQSKQMNEMENLLRYRENMAGVLKASRDELILEKESLTRYSHEMRTVLGEVTKEGKMKERLIKELQEKIDLRERQINKLEKEVRDLEANLMMTNEKRFKLQETIGSMEKELQSTKAHVNQLADINTRYDGSMPCSNNHTDKTIFTHLEPLPENMSPDVEHKKSIRQMFPPFDEQCYQKEVTSRSLLGLSLQKVNVLRSRLNYLTHVSVTPTTSMESMPHSKIIKSCSTQTLNLHKHSQQHLNKMLNLTAKRYEYLQKQAYDSYEELTHLLKLTVSGRKVQED